MRIFKVLTLIIAISFLLIFIIPIDAYSAQWKGYVCRVMDYAECKKGKKRIYPRPERYDDKKTCYEEFEKIYETDPTMNRLYPQTNNAFESYLFGCVKDGFLWW